jgi:hypothetical protein
MDVLECDLDKGTVFDNLDWQIKIQEATQGLGFSVGSLLHCVKLWVKPEISIY